jgi:hypothetical protein
MSYEDFLCRGLTAAEAARIRRNLAAEPGFTHAETRAFDRGLKDGAREGIEAANPFSRDDMRDAWENGKSVGVLNSKEAP